MNTRRTALIPSLLHSLSRKYGNRLVDAYVRALRFHYYGFGFYRTSIDADSLQYTREDTGRVDHTQEYTGLNMSL
jgi:hypothetical protein